MIEVNGVTHRFGAREVLADLSVTLSERRVGVVGANGSGKSTFVRLLNGLLIPTVGRVLVDGLDTRSQGADVRRKVGFVFQNPDNQIVFPLVSEDLAFGLKNMGLSAERIHERITDILRRYGLLHLRDAATYQLSGGEKQLVALSGVLAMEPEYLVLDEPTTLLDLRNKRTVAELISGLPQVVISVTHDLEFLESFERVLVFDEGRVVVDDVPAEAIRSYIERLA